MTEVERASRSRLAKAQSQMQTVEEVKRHQLDKKRAMKRGEQRGELEE